MDQEKTEKYFQHHNSSSTLVVPGTNPANTSGNGGAKDPAQLTNAHHRVRSAPIAFAKGVTDHRNRQLERDGSLGQFQQISLASDSDAVIPPHVHDQKDEVIPRRSLSGNGHGGSFRARASTVTAPAPVVSSLHRSMSLNKHSSRPINSRSNLEDEEEDEDAVQTDRFAEGESLIAPNRFSALLELSPADLNNLNNANRFSATSYNGGLDPVFDPTRYSTASVMFDAKRISNLSSSDEFNNNLPPHQKHHSFHSHYNSPTMRSQETAANDVSSSGGPIVPNHPGYNGDKQELDDDDDDDVHAPAQQTLPQFHVSTPSSISRQGTPSGYPQQQGGPPAFYPQQQQQQQQNAGWPSSNMPLPMSMPVPQPYQPPSVLVSQGRDGEGDAH
ncbi:hypothetical protein BGZ95_002950 [Linnemannia exigua]|uniref:Uncharacterized protein n=1 Tax=Linnemannia exigua TaxID=604196 RepID=A0AAD4D4V3_9FUNG|nr:hypothetical protein BGZ95_002950 [Linnemannia exigua]